MENYFSIRHFALGIGAASFFREGGDEAEKDIAESPTAELKAEP